MRKLDLQIDTDLANEDALMNYAIQNNQPMKQQFSATGFCTTNPPKNNIAVPVPVPKFEEPTEIICSIDVDIYTHDEHLEWAFN